MASLKFGSKVKHKGELFFVVSVGKRVVRARRIFDINPEFNPSGSLTHTIFSLPVKELEKVRTKKHKMT